MSRTVAQWVDYIQTLHCREIDLSLDRVQQVYRNLIPNGVDFKVISIAGTNGKGSTAEMLAAIYRAEGYSVGKYTSPHLVRFNERINLQGQPVSDQELLEALERVEQARDDIALTYFEFGTLAAIDLFAQSEVDIAVLEVGLGGRLDAVNILDADVAIITSLSIDHTAWLGNTIDQIAVEKAGIARAQRPCLVGIRQPPDSLTEACRKVAADLQLLGREFDNQIAGEDAWIYKSDHVSYSELPLPYGQRGVQIDNASLAMRAVECMIDELPVTAAAIKKGLREAHIAGRCQIVKNDPLVIVDVSHNEASVARLREFVVNQKVRGKVFAVCGMLKDKEIAAALMQLNPVVNQWCFASINNERGTSADELVDVFTAEVDPATDSDRLERADNVCEAFDRLYSTLTADDCLLVFGSFFVAGDILRMLENSATFNL